MKLIIAIVHERDKQRVGDALLQQGLTYTKIGSTGGFLRQGNATLLVAVPEDQLDVTLEIMRKAARVAERFVNASEGTAPPSLQMPAIPNIVADKSGGGVAIVVDVERFLHF